MPSRMSSNHGLSSYKATRARRARQRRRDAVPEIALRRALRQQGRVHRLERPLLGMPLRR